MVLPLISLKGILAAAFGEGGWAGGCFYFGVGATAATEIARCKIGGCYLAAKLTGHAAQHTMEFL